MDLHFLMVAEAREAEVARELRRRTLAATVRACRRRVLGFLPIGAPCASPAPAC